MRIEKIKKINYRTRIKGRIGNEKEKREKAVILVPWMSVNLIYNMKDKNQPQLICIMVTSL